MNRTMIVALAVLLPASAHAYDFTTWTEQAPGSYTRTVQLDGGRDYALAADIADGSEGSSPFRLDLSLAGTRIAGLDVPFGDSVSGVTFRAPKAAAYTLALTIPSDQCEPFREECGVAYRINPDCAASTSTLCRLPVGKEEPSRAWNWDGDDDWFRTALRGRRRYEAWLHDPQDCETVFRALDSRGNEVPSSTVGHPGDGISIRFTPPTNGTYFIEALGKCDLPQSYGIALYAR